MRRPPGRPPVFSVTAASAAAVSAAATAAEQKNEYDDPAHVVTAGIVVAHRNTSRTYCG